MRVLPAAREEVEAGGVALHPVRCVRGFAGRRLGVGPRRFETRIEFSGVGLALLSLDARRAAVVTESCLVLHPFRVRLGGFGACARDLL